MYIYADQNGYIKEIVNDKALRQANDNINHIYIYIENFSAVDYDSISVTYKLPNDSIIGPQSVDISNVVEKIIPYNKKRDLKYFKDSKKYEFFDIAIPDGSDPTLGNVLSHTGLVQCTISFINDTSIFALQIIPFYVEESVVRYAYNINSDEYNYLLKIIVSNSVVANPGGVLTETLNSIRIGGINYGIESGGGGGEGDMPFKLVDEVNNKSYKLTLKVKSDGKGHLEAEQQ